MEGRRGEVDRGMVRVGVWRLLVVVVDLGKEVKDWVEAG